MARENQPRTIAQLLEATVAQRGDQQALGLIADGQLSWWSWTELDVAVRSLAVELQGRGVEPGTRVVQVAENSGPWILADLALLMIGAVHVPMHATASTAQIAGQIAHCRPHLVLVDSQQRKTDLAAHLANTVPILLHTEIPGLDSAIRSPPTAFPSALPDNLATILYTSGTTGRPRGVMLSHNNLTSNAVAVTDVVEAGADELRLCFLPLSHIYARTCDLYSWLYRGSRLVLAESRETILRDCRLIGPEVLNGVPYFYQKVVQGVLGSDRAEASDGLRAALGGNIQRCFCGGAAVAPEVDRIFTAQGLPLLAGYGLTEASPVISATTPETSQAGCVGQPLPNVEVRISATEANMGEILVRGPNVMLGYWDDPQATEESLVDGWLLTGDLGEFDASGNLRILGRAKEIIVLSTGKNVSPSGVETLLAGSPLIEQVCVVGEGRKCLAALVVPNPDALRAEIRRRRLWVWSRRRAVSHPQVRQLYREQIDRLLAAVSPEERVGPFAILPRGFSVETDELTVKLSLRREVIAERFAGQIDRLYR